MNESDCAVLRRLHLIGIIEGSSMLLLLFVAMPLKYLANMPEAVRIVGSAHGVLWIIYLLILALTWRALKWPITTVLLGGIASVLPFGPWVFEAKLREQTNSSP